MNHTYFREADIRKEKLNWHSVDKWINPNCALKIIIFYLIFILFYFFSTIRFVLLLYYNYSLPWTVLGMHMPTVRTGIYAPGIWENN